MSQPSPRQPASRPSPAPHHPQVSVLRQRAAGLRALAVTIERAGVLTLDWPAGWGRDATLYDRLLAHNLHQLHRSADELRTVAFGFARRADELEAIRRGSGAA